MPACRFHPAVEMSTTEGAATPVMALPAPDWNSGVVTPPPICVFVAKSYSQYVTSHSSAAGPARSFMERLVAIPLPLAGNFNMLMRWHCG